MSGENELRTRTNQASHTDPQWDLAPPDELTELVGQLGEVRRVTVDDMTHATFIAAVTRAIGTEPTYGLDLADYCPDPLVFALECGLPRPQLFDHVIDGGSEWEQVADVGAGTLIAVPRIAEIAQRTTSDGRRMIRTTYETGLWTERGQFVGHARGVSLDIEDGGK